MCSREVVEHLGDLADLLAVRADHGRAALERGVVDREAVVTGRQRARPSARAPRWRTGRSRCRSRSTTSTHRDRAHQPGGARGAGEVLAHDADAPSRAAPRRPARCPRCRSRSTARKLPQGASRDGPRARAAGARPRERARARSAPARRAGRGAAGAAGGRAGCGRGSRSGEPPPPSCGSGTGGSLMAHQTMPEQRHDRDLQRDREPHDPPSTAAHAADRTRDRAGQQGRPFG